MAHQRPVTAAPSSRQASRSGTPPHSQFEVTSRIPQLLGRAVALSRHLDGAVSDLGCSEGGTLAAFSTVERDRRDERAPLGLELSRTRAAIARRRGLAVVLGNAMRLPLRPGSVAVAISRHVIEHVDDDLGAAVVIAPSHGAGRRSLPGDSAASAVGVVPVPQPVRIIGARPYPRPRVRRRPARGRPRSGRPGVQGGGDRTDPRTDRSARPAVPVASRTLGRLASHVRDLESPALPVPRYREIRVLAVRR